MKQELMDAIQETPVIAAVKDDDGLQNALQNENIRVVFILYGDICSIASIVQRIHAAGKFAIVHVDLIAGLASKEVAVDFIRSQTEADGIISTRQSFIRRAKELGLAAHPPGVPAGLHLAGEPGQDALPTFRTVWTSCPAPCPKFCAGCARTPKCRCSRAA